MAAGGAELLLTLLKGARNTAVRARCAAGLKLLAACRAPRCEGWGSRTWSYCSAAATGAAVLLASGTSALSDAIACDAAAVRGGALGVIRTLVQERACAHCTLTLGAVT